MGPNGLGSNTCSPRYQLCGPYLIVQLYKEESKESALRAAYKY